MLGIGGLEAIHRIKAQHPTARTLVFGMLNNASHSATFIKTRHNWIYQQTVTGFITLRNKENAYLIDYTLQL